MCKEFPLQLTANNNNNNNNDNNDNNNHNNNNNNDSNNNELCHYLQLSVILTTFTSRSFNKLFSNIPSCHLYSVFIKNAFHDFPCSTSSVTVTHSRFSDVRSSSQKLIFSLSTERYCKILSEFWTSRKLTRNLQPFIRLYWEKHLQLDHSAVQQLLRTDKPHSISLL